MHACAIASMVLLPARLAEGSAHELFGEKQLECDGEVCQRWWWPCLV